MKMRGKLITFWTGRADHVENGERVVWWQGCFTQRGDKRVAWRVHSQDPTQRRVDLLRFQDGLGRTFISTR